MVMVVMMITVTVDDGYGEVSNEDGCGEDDGSDC